MEKTEFVLRKSLTLKLKTQTEQKTQKNKGKGPLSVEFKIKVLLEAYFSTVATNLQIFVMLI